MKLKLRMQEGSIDRSPNRSKLNQKRSNWLANSNFTSIKDFRFLTKQLNIHRRTMVRIIAVEWIKLCFFDLIFRKRSLSIIIRYFVKNVSNIFVK